MFCVPFSWVDIFCTRGELGLLPLAKTTLRDGDEGDSLNDILGTDMIWDLEVKLKEYKTFSSLGSKPGKLFGT